MHVLVTIEIEGWYGGRLHSSDMMSPDGPLMEQNSAAVHQQLHASHHWINSFVDMVGMAELA